MMLLRQHLPALILSFVMALAIGIPQFVVIQQMGADYQGIFPISSDDDRYYEARSHEVRDGFPHLGNPYVLELRDAPAVSFWMPDAVLSYTGALLGVDVQHTFALFDFVLPVFLFLVLYATLLLATGARLLSLVATALFHLGFFLDAFTQAPSPQFNFLFLELSLLAAVAVVQRIRFASYFLALSLGALFYVYPYFWTFAFAAVGMFFLLTLVWPELREFRGQLFAALASGTVIGAPVLLQMFQAGQSQAYRETILRLGMIYSHTPGGLASIMLSVGTLCAFAFVWRFVPQSRYQPRMWFFASLTLGGLIAANNNVVTGQNLEFSSHYFLPVAYVVLLALTYLCALVNQALPHTARMWYLRALVLAAVSGVTIFGAADSVMSRLWASDSARSEQKYGPVVQWLTAHTSPESVVLAPDYTSYLIAAYTADRIFYSRNANLHVMTDSEAWTRFILEYWDATLDDAFLQTHVGEIWGAHYFDEYGHQMQLNKVRKILGRPQVVTEVIPQQAKDDFRAFAAQLKQNAAENVLADRTIDYAITENGFLLPSWMRTVYPDMRVAENIGEFTIYQLGARQL